MKTRPFTHTAGILMMVCGTVVAQTDSGDPDITLAPDITLGAEIFNAEFGSAFAVAGDINGDGVVDFAVADRSAIVNDEVSSGSAYIVSGSDGSYLRTYYGIPARAQYFGASLASLDCDGDGVMDLAVGSPGRANDGGYGAGSYGAGAVTVYSGADGSVLLEVGGARDSQFGTTMVNAGDQNGDGVDDLFVGAPLANSAKGQVITLSGADGTIIRTLNTDASPYSGFGLAIAASDDIDGDGFKELVVATPGHTEGDAFGAGRVQLICSCDGNLVSEIFGLSFYNRLGNTLANAGDVNGDGVGEILVGSFWNGTMLLVSGADLSLVRDLSQTLPGNRSINVGGSVDFDGDGVEDWLFGSTGMAVNDAGQIVGGIRVLSGADDSILLERIGGSPITAMGQNLKVLPEVGIAAGESRLQNSQTGGYGAVYLWKVNQILDSDGDGIPDDEDENPNSNMNPTINILGRDTGVNNFVGGNGVTLADLFDGLGTLDDYNNQTHYFTAVVHLTNQLRDQGLISDQDRKAINSAARGGAVQSGGRGRR